jgi:hypothetical protein
MCLPDWAKYSFCNKTPMLNKVLRSLWAKKIIHLAITWLVQLRTNTTTAFETLRVYALAYNIWYFLQPPRAVNCCLFIANTCCKEVRIVTLFLIFVASAPSFFWFKKMKHRVWNIIHHSKLIFHFLCFLMLW